MKQTAEEIALSNLDMGFDSVGAYGDGSLSDALAAHMVNAIDTAREYRVSADEVARIYMRETFKRIKKRGRKKATKRKRNPVSARSLVAKAMK